MVHVLEYVVQYSKLNNGCCDLEKSGPELRVTNVHSSGPETAVIRVLGFKLQGHELSLQGEENGKFPAQGEGLQENCRKTVQALQTYARNKNHAN